MDFPLCCDAVPVRRMRSPVALWLLLASIGVVVGIAALAAALATDTREFASRHGTALAPRAL